MIGELVFPLLRRVGGEVEERGEEAKSPQAALDVLDLAFGTTVAPAAPSSLVVFLSCGRSSLTLASGEEEETGCSPASTSPKVRSAETKWHIGGSEDESVPADTVGDEMEGLTSRVRNCTAKLVM